MLSLQPSWSDAFNLIRLEIKQKRFIYGTSNFFTSKKKRVNLNSNKIRTSGRKRGNMIIARFDLMSDGLELVASYSNRINNQ